MTEKIKTSPTDIRKFGILFAGVCLALAAYTAWRHHSTWPYFLAGAGFFLVTGLFLHAVLKPIYVGWMKFAFVLGWINTRLLLGIFFYLILTPGSLLMRVFGKRPLQLRFDRTATTYWVKREPAEFKRERYEQLF